MEFLIITGLSGAGKTRVVDICEDMDYYCVDNLPIALMDRFAELCLATKGRFERVALVLDARASRDRAELIAAVESLSALDCGLKILFMEADDATLIRRYKESRRPHPMAAGDNSLIASIANDRSFMEPLRQRADYIIDTSTTSLSDLQNKLYSLLAPEKRYFSVSIGSFGFKYGIPPESDMVLDVRCLPNPYYRAELKNLSGLDKPVADFIFSSESACTMLNKLYDALQFLLPLYEEEGRHLLTISVGCTGGRHRSVAMAKALADRLADAGWNVQLTHRDTERDGQ